MGVLSRRWITIAGRRRIMIEITIMASASMTNMSETFAGLVTGITIPGHTTNMIMAAGHQMIMATGRPDSQYTAHATA